MASARMLALRTVAIDALVNNTKLNENRVATWKSQDRRKNETNHDNSVGKSKSGRRSARK
jgi:hypothetical protein